MVDEKRRADRFEIARLAFAGSTRGATTIGDVLGNISTDGVSIGFNMPADDLSSVMSDGLEVDLVIDDFPALGGTAARTLPNRVAVAFSPESRTQRNLPTHILNAVGEDYEVEISADE